MPKWKVKRYPEEPILFGIKQGHHGITFQVEQDGQLDLCIELNAETTEEVLALLELMGKRFATEQRDARKRRRV